jgi:hypothetical protein
LLTAGSSKKLLSGSLLVISPEQFKGDAGLLAKLSELNSDRSQPDEIFFESLFAGLPRIFRPLPHPGSAISSAIVGL